MPLKVDDLPRAREEGLILNVNVMPTCEKQRNDVCLRDTCSSGL